MAIECGLDASAVPVSGGNSGECERARFRLRGQARKGRGCFNHEWRCERIERRSVAARGGVTNFYATFDLQRSTILSSDGFSEDNSL